MLKPGKSHANNLQAFLKSLKRHHSRSIWEQSTYRKIWLIISNALFLQRNETTVLANNGAINSMAVISENKGKVELETLLRSVGAVHRIKKAEKF